MRRYGTPAEIAAAALFLLDPARSGYITGQTLSVDGGFVAAGLMSGTSRAANAGDAGTAWGVSYQSLRLMVNDMSALEPMADLARAELLKADLQTSVSRAE